MKSKCLFTALPLALALLSVLPLGAQQPKPPEPKKEPDVLIFVDGEKLVGKLVSSAGGSLTFASDMAGTVTVDWTKVKELHTSNQYAVIPKSVNLARRNDGSSVPQGTVAMADQKIEVTPAAGGAPQTVAVADSGNIVSEGDFQKAIAGSDGFFHDWKGGITGGASLVESTQKSQVFTGAVTLVRAEPTESWLAASNKTIFDFSASYGKVSEPNTPDIKTEIIHADGERDQYFSPRFYAFGQFAFDHNFSQGLDLQQLYGGGIGWTAIKRPKQQLDLKVSMSFIRQQFNTAVNAPTNNQNLIGSTFADTYLYRLPHGMVFNQSLVLTPAWNNTNAYSALGSASLLFPAYKNVGVSLSVLDTFLNDPPVGFKKNSFQLSAGVTYTIK